MKVIFLYLSLKVNTKIEFKPYYYPGSHQLEQDPVHYWLFQMPQKIYSDHVQHWFEKNNFNQLLHM